MRGFERGLLVAAVAHLLGQGGLTGGQTGQTTDPGTGDQTGQAANPDAGGQTDQPAAPAGGGETQAA